MQTPLPMGPLLIVNEFLSTWGFGYQDPVPVPLGSFIPKEREGGPHKGWVNTYPLFDEVIPKVSVSLT